MEIESLKNIPATFSVVKRSLIICLIVSITTTIAALIYSFVMVQQHARTTFVLTKEGKAILLNSTTAFEVDQYRKPEIINHIKEFHKLFFEIDERDYEKKLNRALHMIGNSGKDLYLTLNASGYYSNIAANNLRQELIIDSIFVEDHSSPYSAQFFGKLIVRRTDQQLERTQKLYSKFELQNVARTEDNPHGLLMENYIVRGID